MKLKKKIIFATEALWIGGIETALINLLNRIDFEKYDVTLLVTRASLELADRVNPKCRLIVSDRDKAYTFHTPYKYARLYHLTEKSENPSTLHKALMWTVPVIRWVENRLYINYIRDQMSKEAFDTCVIYSDRLGETACRGLKSKKYLLFFHNALIEKAYHDEISYKSSDKIIAVSESKAAELKAFRQKYADKIISIHNIVDTVAIIQRSKEIINLPFLIDDFNLVTCGRLAHQKAIDWAITACKSLVEKGYYNLQWWVLGSGPDEEKLKSQIAEAGIGNHFHLLGAKTNPYPYMANADLYVQPSRYENYSVVVLEAMALYKPILATIPAADQQIKSGVNGMLCEPDPDSIAAGIEMLINHPEERERYRSYLIEHSLEKENEEIMQLLYNLL